MANQTTRRSRAARPHGKRRTPAQPDTEDQSGSAGRRNDAHLLDKSKDTGQDRYGQSGFGGKRRGRR